MRKIDLKQGVTDSAKKYDVSRSVLQSQESFYGVEEEERDFYQIPAIPNEGLLYYK